MANTGDPAEPACETGPPEHCLIGNSINHSSCDWYLFFEPQSLSSSESDLQRRDVPFDTEYVNRVIKPPTTLRVFQRGEVNAVMDKINALRRLDNTRRIGQATCWNPKPAKRPAACCGATAVSLRSIAGFSRGNHLADEHTVTNANLDAVLTEEEWSSLLEVKKGQINLILVVRLPLVARLPFAAVIAEQCKTRCNREHVSEGVPKRGVQR